MEEVLFGDPSNHIIAYLTPLNLYNLCKTCKQFRIKLKKSHFEKATIRNIRKKLYDLFLTKDKLDGFLNSIKGGIINGNFIVGSISGNYAMSLTTYISKVYDECTTIKINCYYPNTHKLTSALAFHRPYHIDSTFLDGADVEYCDKNRYIMFVISHRILKFFDNIGDFFSMYKSPSFQKSYYWYDGEDHFNIKSFNDFFTAK